MRDAERRFETSKTLQEDEVGRGCDDDDGDDDIDDDDDDDDYDDLMIIMIW